MPVLVYGAYGFTGRLITEACLARGLEVVVAGRDAPRVEDVARQHEVPFRVFPVEERRALLRALDEVDVVMNVAGPFVHTAPPILKACLQSSTHYLDISGELEVLEHLAQQDAGLQEAGIMAVPGVGFDIVASDCLAAHLSAQLPLTTILELAVIGSGAVSRGTARTALRQLGRPGYIRREGEIVPVPPAWKTRRVDLGHRVHEVVSVPLGDVIAAPRHTGIPSIIGYAALPPLARLILLWSRQLEWLFRLPLVKGLLRLWAETYYTGPSARRRKTGRSYVWGRVADEEGRERVAVLALPETYAFTAEAAAAAAEKVLGGTVRPGFQTPVTAFGSDFAFEVAEVQLLEW